MARPSATAALLLLALSLLAVAHCRRIEADPAESSAAVAASDDNGPANPALPVEVEEMALPAEEQEHHQHGGLLRLPSHRHRPCRHGHGLHRHLWWARHHGVFGDAPRRFHPAHVRGESRGVVLPAEETVDREAEEVKAVAEPDPDRSLPNSDGEGQLEPSFRDDADGEEGEAVRAWKKEMLRRWLHFHHGMRRHRLDHDGHDEEGEEKKTVRKWFRPAEHDDDSDDEDDEVEEMVRRFRKAIMTRRRFGHGRRFHHHHHHHGQRHAGAAEKADGEEEGGVMAWVRGLMNRF